MNDPLSGIKQIMPTYPAKPARPVRQRDSDRQRRQPAEPAPGQVPDEDADKPTIDEYI